MTSEEKRKAHYALPSATRKEMAEMKVFKEFISASALSVDPGTAKNEKPPIPDIRCTIDGTPYMFELGEITDEELAEKIAVCERTQTDGEGGFFSEEGPLVRMILKKAQSTYQTGGVLLDLVLHYDRQYPFAPVEYLDRHEAEISTAMTPKGPFSRIWIYDSWEKRILWKRA
jgi:hypothetical protein